MATTMLPRPMISAGEMTRFRRLGAVASGWHRHA
jgi:hypothetical protein